MRIPAYVILPLSGTVVLTAAVLGSWLWPESKDSSPASAPSVVATSGTPETLAPPPTPRSSPVRPSAQLPAAKPTPAVVQQPNNTATPTTVPAVAEPPSPAARYAEMSPDQRLEIKQKWSSLRTRAADMAMKGVQALEHQRDEAQARGDQAEVTRLDAIIALQKDRVEKMRLQAAEPPSTGPGLPPAQQAGAPEE